MPTANFEAMSDEELKRYFLARGRRYPTSSNFRLFLLIVIAECEQELTEGAAVTVEPSRIRIRRLPLVSDL